MNITYTPFFKKLCNIFNIPFDEFNFPKITQLSTNLIIDRYLGKPFPTVFTEEDYQNIQHLHSWYNYFIYRGDLAKAKIFWKASKIISDFDSRIQNVNAKIPKFIFLSGHDTDIFPFNNILNFSSS